jgi:release factor glutamine methyltransferase
LPELVEGLPFTFGNEEGQPFDKLREGGCLVLPLPFAMTVRSALADAERRLSAMPGQPRQDAELLMAHALGVSVGEMKLRYLDQAAPPGFEPLLQRRFGREPIPYITGRAGFWTIELEVGPGVLIPRADSETLIAAAVEHFGGRGPASILDLGTGPGTLLLAALDQWPDAQGVGVDASAVALDYARRNLRALGVEARAQLVQGDWGAALDRRFDLILCNPPYIPTGTPLEPDVRDWEPHEALFAGPDGLDAYRALAPQIARLLAPGGVACIELGDGQFDAAEDIFVAGGFTISSRLDLRGRDRCLVLRLT